GKVTGDVMAQSNGTVAPGAGGAVGSTSTLTVAGKMTFNQGSFFGVNVPGATSPGQGKADLLNVDSASLGGGTVKVATNATQAQVAMARWSNRLRSCIRRRPWGAASLADSLFPPHLPS